MAKDASQDFTHASEITMQTYRQVAASYARRNRPEVLPPFWQENIQRFTAHVQAHPAWQANPALPILEVGCGHGRDALLFAQQGFEVQAIDLSPDMLEQARQLCLSQPDGARITFQQMDMRRLEFPAASYTGAWVSASFLHIPKSDNLLVLSELERVLIPGGFLTLLVKQADARPAERYDIHPESGTPRFFARYRGGELWDLLEQAGLRVLSLVSHPSDRGDSWLGALAQKTGDAVHPAEHAPAS